MNDRHIVESLDQAYARVADALWAERTRDGYWIGELASSALATATAVSALSLSRTSGGGGAASHSSGLLEDLVRAGIEWLVAHQNDDGGWGDTPVSQSNISTTMLVRAALHLAHAETRHERALIQAVGFIESRGGTAAVAARYGKDRTFAVPILVNCALAGQADWSGVPPLPFELACLPQSLFRFLRLHVVSYALPALIAIGQLIQARRPGGNLFTRAVRSLARAPSLRKLESIQPASGGFLEAVPLTSFVVMSLAALGQRAHPVAQQGIQFLINSARPDGSWPIDSNLSVWLTTLSVNALFSPRQPSGLDEDEVRRTASWILGQQLRFLHPYTQAAPGGWGWSHLSGSVPDVDDSAGALLALSRLPGIGDPRHKSQIADGIAWLLSLQNSDGGWPTFCRGWGKLPFDRSAPDLTAHALRALSSWTVSHAPPRIQRARNRGLAYLCRQQQADGSWLPLWFGNESGPNQSNPTFGTSRVLEAYRDLDLMRTDQALRGIAWLLKAQNKDGGWGGGPGIESSIEETALAVCALSAPGAEGTQGNSLRRGVQWLVERVESAAWRNPAPIGLYFAKLWYYEKLYPLIFLSAALGRARHCITPRAAPTPAHGS